MSIIERRSAVSRKKSRMSGNGLLKRVEGSRGHRQTRNRGIIATCVALTLLILVVAIPKAIGPAARVQAQAGDVHVLFTADNAYGFGYGDESEMKSYFGGIENRVARDIFSCNPAYGVEAYTVPMATVDDFLYIVAWSDKAVTQGVIGQFNGGGETIYTGIGTWEAYGTGEDYRPPSAGPGPDLASINRHIADANAGMGDPADTSVAWVPDGGDPDGIGLGALAFGEANDPGTGGNFPGMSCLDPRARWMWYNSDPDAWPNPFRGGPSPGGHKEFVIFRLPVREVLVTPTPSLSPTASPSPTPTETPSPTPTFTPSPTPKPSPVYLPILLRERCPPSELFVDAVLVIDASTTMRGRTVSGRLKIDAAVEAARVFMQGLRLEPGRDRVAIATFNAEAQTMSMLSHDRASLEAALDRIELAEGSRIDLGLGLGRELAIAGARADGLPALVLLTDGRVNGATPDDVLREADEARAAEIALYVVGLGEDRDEGLLRGIAGADGLYVPAPDADLLSAIYADLAERVPCPPEAYWGRR